MSQLTSVSMRFSETRKALLFGKADAPVDVSEMETIYAEYPDTILRRPRLRGFRMQLNVRRRVAAFLRLNVAPERSLHEWMQYLPERCEQWGKLRIGDGGDCIQCACSRNPLSTHGKRDKTFVRFECDVDKNYCNRRETEMIIEIGYGRLDFILAITLPVNPDFNIHSPQLHVLAHITEAQDAKGDASTQLISYQKLGRSFVLEATTVKSVVGQVETKGIKPNGEWIIIDRSDTLCRTTFHQEEQEYEDDNQPM